MIKPRYLFCLLLLISHNLFSQIELPLDLKKWLNQDKIKLSHDANQLYLSISNAFDGISDNYVRSVGVDSFSIQIEFDQPIVLTQSRILLAFLGGEWQIDLAESLEDYNSQSGTYQVLFSNKPLLEEQWGEEFIPEIATKIIGIKIIQPGVDNVFLREIELKGQFNITGIEACPAQIQLAIGDEYEFNDGLYYLTENEYTFSTSNLQFEIGDGSEYASLEGNNLTANAAGNAIVLVSVLPNTYDSLFVCIEEDPQPELADPLTAKVALVIENPVVPESEGQRFHELLGWNDPVALIQEFELAMETASNGTVDYEIVITFMEDDTMFARVDQLEPDIQGWYELYAEPSIATLAKYDQEGYVYYDFDGMMEYYELCEASEAGEISEVWIWGHPKAGGGAILRAGEADFFNAIYALPNTSCINKLPILGFDYSKPYSKAMQTYGIFIEQSLIEAFGRLDYEANSKNKIELFTTYNSVGVANVGRVIHPPNSNSWKYSDTTTVYSQAYNWYNYPFLGNQGQDLNCTDWDCTEEGFVQWWYDKIPHFKGTFAGVLNNWWHYAVNFDEAKSLALATDCNSFNYCDFPDSKDSLEINKLYFKCMPNFTSSETFVQLANSDEIQGILQLIDFNGQVLQAHNLEISQSITSYQISLNEYPPGIYFVSIILDDGNKYVEKLIRT